MFFTYHIDMKMKKRMISTPLPTTFGLFDFWVWDGERGREPIALSTPKIDPEKEVLIRIHSECVTGDAFGTLTCDCGFQKEEALRAIAKQGNGIFIYHRQEGRNMGLFKKIQAYTLMKQGVDTHEANILLSGSPDAREYSEVLEILNNFFVDTRMIITLLSNNPYKKIILERAGYRVKMRSLHTNENIQNTEYIRTKKQKFLQYSPTYMPYVGITLSQSDVCKQASIIAQLIDSFDRENRGRKIFFGIPLFSQKGDLKNSILAKKLNQFADFFTSIRDVHIVLHIEYDARRQYYRDLKNFLSLLHFRYSFQFRFSQLMEASKIDLEIIESLHAEYCIFQIQKSQCALLRNEKVAAYLYLPNSFVLLDDSLGKGTQEHIVSAKEKVLKVVEKGICHIAIAGGYSSTTLKNISALEDYFAIPISVDAESKLRKNGQLSILEAQKYLAFFFPVK